MMVTFFFSTFLGFFSSFFDEHHENFKTVRRVLIMYRRCVELKCDAYEEGEI